MSVLHLQQICPESPLWTLFLTISVDYFLEIWPETFKDKSHCSLMHDYDQQLRKRIEEGGRFLFLCKREKETLGFANAYIISRWIPNSGRTAHTLHIAEFSILPPWRRQGLGTCFLQILVDFGKKKGIEMVWAEVDMINKSALKFWKCYFSDFMKTDSRLSFWKVLNP